MTDLCIPDATRDRIEALLVQGKNVYQPLYNAPFAPSIAPLRPCDDRCRAVEASMGDRIAGRKLWDVGCSLGYNTLYFVERGMIGHGIDIDPRNVAICNEIAGWTRGEARFSLGALTPETVETIAPGEYDYAFFFSVLHHIIEVRGLAAMQDMMREITSRIPTIYVELALRREIPPPGYTWDRHLPEDELAIFSTCSGLDITPIGRFDTHVGPMQRPLYRVSGKVRS
ncbi:MULTISPECIES: class I SAM-dependent methyltransferase [Paracoccus]|uniref:Methyltransferase domain-containing protein n=1 Tax=Paracoccus litorisediminis TaxID=2006130 RepID=A0A844HME6_9RHOB|nr:class I SAM-dependent methyltransferase [Paracoccus sp. PAR01]MTH61036.1 methyltransferase domain-containing protein [Paracoccus litorisediminis]